MKKSLYTRLWAIFLCDPGLFTPGFVDHFSTPTVTQFARFLGCIGLYHHVLAGITNHSNITLEIHNPAFSNGETAYDPSQNVNRHIDFIGDSPCIVIINNPKLLLLNFTTAPWRARAALISVLAMLILIVTSVWREDIKMRYDVWRLHDAMTAGCGVAFFHMFRINYFVAYLSACHLAEF